MSIPFFVGLDKYNLSWPEDYDELAVELAMIRLGGKCTVQGKECGLGMFEHLMVARKLIWPNRYQHRWTELMYHNFIQNDVTVLMGCASAQKTSHAVEYCLLNYWARPDNTLVVLSTVNMDKLDIGCWAELKMLWSEGREKYPWLAGNLIEHKRALTTENLEEDGVRDMRKGVIGRPCYSGGRWVGLGILAGLKQDYIFYVADELTFMQEAFSMSWPHLFSNGNVKIIGSGNPRHDPDDELGKTAEPQCGWNAMPEPEKTAVWDTKFMGGKCINLVGTDSPNFDVAEDQPIPFPRLINRKFANRIAHDHGEGSFEYYRLVKGVMKVAFVHSRVITRQLCRDHHALDQVSWKNDQQTHIYALDPSYGGEDRCVGMPAMFGEDIDGTQILLLMPYRVFPLDLRKESSAEDQIAEILEQELKTYEVTPENTFYDSCGKGTIGAAFARRFGHRVPVAVDAGARPSKRPVREDLFVEENDGTKRLKRCDEHYSKFVSELWFSVRYAIEADQVRGLLEDVMTEGCARIYEMAAGNKIEVEPKSDPKKKEDLKRRLGKSPDLFDCFTGNTKILTPTGERRLDCIYPGDEIVTPFGTTRVAVVHVQEVSKLTTVSFSNGASLVGKGKHKVFVWGKGWVRLDALSIDNEIESSHTLPIWNILNSLFTKDESSSFKAMAGTTKMAGTTRRRDFYTDVCGLTTTALFLRGIASITRMATGQIIESRTWNWLKSANTKLITWLNDLNLSNGLLRKLLPLVESLQRSGIDHQKEGNGIPNMERMFGKKEPIPQWCANCAEKNSTPSRQEIQCSAQPNVGTSATGIITKIQESALFAVRILSALSTLKQRIVPIVVRRSQLPASRKVYNLTLVDHNVYYANGILVDNCVAICTEGARQRGFKIRRLTNPGNSDANNLDWLKKKVEQHKKLIQSKQLTYA